jgi:hypothetical protein
MYKYRSITIIIFLMTIIVSVHAVETVSILFTSDKENAEMALVNAELGELYRLKPGEKIEISTGDEWSAQVKSGNTRLTIVFTPVPGVVNELIASFSRDYLVNKASSDGRIPILREQMQMTVKDIYRQLERFKTETASFPSITTDTQQLNNLAERIESLAVEAEDIWIYGLVSSRNGEIVVLQRNFLNMLSEMREEFVTKASSLVVEAIENSYRQTVESGEFDIGLEQLLSIENTFSESISLEISQLLMNYREQVYILKRDFRTGIESQLATLYPEQDWKPADYKASLETLEKLEQELINTQSDFPGLLDEISRAKVELENHRKDSFKRKPEQIVRGVSWGSASALIVLATSSMAIGVSAFVLRNDAISDFNSSFYSYNRASLETELDLYWGRMQSSIVTANNWYYTGLVLIPVSIFLGLSGTFLYFVDFIYRKKNGNVSQQNFIRIRPEIAAGTRYTRLGVVIRL